jgi:hypothetical protein
MSYSGVHAGTSTKPRTLDRDELLAERVRLNALPASPDRAAALKKIRLKLKSIENRSERNGV